MLSIQGLWNNTTFFHVIQVAVDIAQEMVRNAKDRRRMLYHERNRLS